MYRNGFYRHRIVGVVVILLTVSLFPTIVLQQPTPTKTATFVLAAWDYPDEYGQGIESVYVASNATGSWVSVGPDPFYSTDDTRVEIPAGGNLRLIVYSYLNRSYIGLPEPWNQGHLYIRHRVDVTALSTGEGVFSQQNFTYDAFGGTADQVEWYKHTVILSFIPIGGETYSAFVNYEIYHEATETEYLNDGSSLDGITLYGAGGLGEGDYGIGSDGDIIEFWIMPDSAGPEGVQYKLEFTDINNTESSMNVSIRFRVEGSTNHFYYFVVYGDASNDGSDTSSSTSWANLEFTVDNKIIDYILLANYDTPSTVASGNLSVWIDYIQIFSFFDQWNENTELVFYYSVSIDEWGMNTSLVLLGLIMIPASTLYLVRGGRDELSNDKLFFFLIFVMVGFGLLIGGIMP